MGIIMNSSIIKSFRTMATSSELESTIDEVENENYEGMEDDAPITEQVEIVEEEFQVEEAPLWPSGIDKTLWDLGKTLYKRLFHFGPLAALFIIITVGMTTSILHVFWWPIDTPFGCLDFLIFLTWNCQVVSNFLNAAYIGGGYIPLNWFPPAEEDQTRLQHCQTCNGFKAPRSHHCTKCKRCVMKMDHHCPWINNCVGHRNQTYFIRFLFFAVIGCTHAAIILGNCLWNTVKELYFYDPYYRYTEKEEPAFFITSTYMFFAAIMSLSFSIGVFTALSFLLYVQMKIVFKNVTGIEEYICLKANYRRGQSARFLYPYDLGWKRNLLDVYNGGKKIPKGDGIWWPIRRGCTQFSFSEEQLIQKAIKRRRLLQQGPPVEEVGCCKRFYRRLVKVVLWQTHAHSD